MQAETAIEKAEVRVVDRIYRILDKDLVKVTFTEKSYQLADASQVSVKGFVAATEKEAQIDRYLVAAWSDKDYPNKGKLSDEQEKIAKARAEEIKKVIESVSKVKVETFEMTKQPNWIQRAFSTETAEIKDKSLSDSRNETVIKEIGKRLRDNGGPGTAVIVAKFKNEVLTN
jgi:hypothetical protein